MQSAVVHYRQISAGMIVAVKFGKIQSEHNWSAFSPRDEGRGRKPWLIAANKKPIPQYPRAIDRSRRNPQDECVRSAKCSRSKRFTNCEIVARLDLSS